ncbi:Ankyrin repeat-containing domain protein [Rhypophila sp. PSN 637]
MDPISATGLASAIIGLAGTIAKAVNYVNDIKEAPVERAQFACEASSLLALLTALRYRVDEAQSETDPWFSSAQKLGQNGGPLSQLQEHLDKVNNKLTMTSKVKAFAKNLVWTLDKKEVKETLSHIERVRSLVSLALENDHLNLSWAIKEQIDQVQVNVETTTLVQQNKEEMEREKILSWLSPLDSTSKQHSLYKRRQPGTGDWFLNDPTFTAWLDGAGERILWCPGPPGVGKSSIASLVISLLEAQYVDNEMAVSYVFCNYKEAEFQTITNLMAELLCHILQRTQAIPEDVRTLYNRHHPKGTRPEVDDVAQILGREVNKYSRVFIVVDALDECPERDDTRWQFLAQLQSLPENNIRLLCTSRDIPSIKREFDGSSLLEVRATDDDIKSYLAGRIDAETSHQRKRILTTPGLRDDIIETITARAKGMFLLAELHMESLSRWLTAREVREELAYLPEGLDDTYEQAMQRIQAQDSEELAISVLSWIVFAFRPLTLRELQHALAVQDSDRDLDPAGIPDEESIVSACAGLVMMDEESGKIHLVHYTTQEYFERHDIRREYFRYAPIALAEILCLKEELRRRYSEYWLFDYAQSHWGAHHDPRNPGVDFTQQPNSIDELRTKAYWSSTPILDLCLSREPNLDNQNHLGDTPLLYALRAHWGEHFEVGGYFILPIRETTWMVERVNHLLDHGASAFASNRKCETALHHAVHSPELLALFLTMGVDPTQPLHGSTPLHVAAKEGQLESVRLLLDHGAVVDAIDETHCDDSDSEFYSEEESLERQHTPLSKAAKYGRLEIVRLLLSRGADANLKLSCTSSRGHIRSESILYRTIENGESCPNLDLDDLGAQKVIPDRDAIVDALLEYGADLDAAEEGIGGYTETVLHRAAALGRIELVQQLLDRGADPEIPNGKGETALDIARSNCYQIIGMLIEKYRMKRRKEICAADVQHAVSRQHGRCGYVRSPTQVAEELGKLSLHMSVWLIQPRLRNLGGNDWIKEQLLERLG